MLSKECDVPVTARWQFKPFNAILNDSRLVESAHVDGSGVRAQVEYRIRHQEIRVEPMFSQSSVAHNTSLPSQAASNEFRVGGELHGIGLRRGVQAQRFAGAARNDVEMHVRYRLARCRAIDLDDHDARHLECALDRGRDALSRANTGRRHDPWPSWAPLALEFLGEPAA
jgi:hypothetical protein